MNEASCWGGFGGRLGEKVRSSEEESVLFPERITRPERGGVFFYFCTDDQSLGNGNRRFVLRQDVTGGLNRESSAEAAVLYR